MYIYGVLCSLWRREGRSALLGVESRKLELPKTTNSQLHPRERMPAPPSAATAIATGAPPTTMDLSLSTTAATAATNDPIGSTSTTGTTASGTNALATLSIADPQSLALLLHSPDPAVVTAAVHALARYLSSVAPTDPRVAVDILVPCIPRLLALLAPPASPLPRADSVPPPAIASTDSNGGAHIQSSSTVALRRGVAATLAALCAPTSAPLIPHAAAASILSTLLTRIIGPAVVSSSSSATAPAFTETPEVLDESLSAVGGLAARDYATRNAVRSLGGVVAIAAMMAHADPDVKRAATVAMGVCMDDYACRTAARTAGALATLLENAASEYPEIMEAALTAVQKTALDAASRAELRSLGAHRRLYELLIAAAAPATLAAASVAANAATPASQQSPSSPVPGASGANAAALSPGGATTAPAAATTQTTTTTTSAATNNTTAASMAALGAQQNGTTISGGTVTNAVNFVAVVSPSSIPLLLYTLAAVLDDRSTATLAVTRDCPGIVDVAARLAVKDDSRLRRAALDLLRAVARDNAAQPAIRDSGIVGALVKDIGAGADAGGVRSAAIALAAIMAHDANEPETIKAGAVDVLVARALAAASIEESSTTTSTTAASVTSTKEALVLALASCLGYAKCRARLRAHPSTAADLLKLVALAPSTGGLLPAACAALGAAADDDLIRCELVRLEAIQTLLGRLQPLVPPTDPSAPAPAAMVPASKSAVLRAMSRILQEPAARTVLRTAEGVAVIADVVQSAVGDTFHHPAAPRQNGAEEAVVVAASWVISVASNDDTLAAAFCAAGLPAMLLPCIEPIPVARSALDKLLNHHLSARYWLYSRLEPHHTLAGISFYDTNSRASTGATKFPTLESLRTCPVDSRPPVVHIGPTDAAVENVVGTVLRELDLDLPALKSVAGSSGGESSTVKATGGIESGGLLVDASGDTVAPLLPPTPSTDKLRPTSPTRRSISTSRSIGSSLGGAAGAASSSSSSSAAIAVPDADAPSGGRPRSPSSVRMGSASANAAAAAAAAAAIAAAADRPKKKTAAAISPTVVYRAVANAVHVQFGPAGDAMSPSTQPTSNNAVVKPRASPSALALAAVKVTAGSNVIEFGDIPLCIAPLSLRALLFKAVCDRLGVVPAVSLVRGEYGRVWNAVDAGAAAMAVASGECGGECVGGIVDLERDIGAILADGSPEAERYVRL
ncbi:hypothetical protein BC828DRAFT_390043 [Blastocladiella britannica]|nr:hypothetical protein BC828DRAFT_390043 [Blastocladiella britannica]